MIEKLKRLFEIETIGGRAVLIMASYFLFWFIFGFLGFWVFNYIGINWGLPDQSLYIYYLVIVPVISFSIPIFLQKMFFLNKIWLYVLHVISIPVMLVICYWVVIYFGFQDFGSF